MTQLGISHYLCRGEGEGEREGEGKGEGEREGEGKGEKEMGSRLFQIGWGERGAKLFMQKFRRGSAV